MTMLNDALGLNRRITGRRHFLRWGGRRASRFRGKVGALRDRLPSFQRRRAAYGGDDEIVHTHRDDVVVGRVSSSYALVQHRELLDALPDVLGNEGYAMDDLDADLLITRHGERMELVIDLPALGDTPPDGFALACRLRCLNSVDRSTPVEAELQWYRQVCSNGMFGWGGRPVRRAHRFDDTVQWIQSRLHRRFDQLPADRLHFAQMTRMRVPWNNVSDWADVFVARRWGKIAAARVLHVCRTGWDAKVEFESPDLAPSEQVCTATVQVPGACAPVTNVYHVGQALSWVAGNVGTLNGQFSMTGQVPGLMAYLVG